MVNEGFLLVGKMILGIFIKISLKVACPTSVLGYPGPPFIPFNVFGNQPLIKMSWLTSNNAEVVWSSPTPVGNVQDGSAKCLVQVSAGLCLPHPSVLGVAGSSMNNSVLHRTVMGAFPNGAWTDGEQGACERSVPSLGPGCQISCKVGLCS